ncbi:uncharacterized protein LAESUDRAFT_461612 [Laetiporus sulphureus 93-53]|uniref:Restriction of telomere capping protein 4 n=1 Tax=Laetiporus sulphureus 93-53 TaxID=1314785 RepID=A0A165G4U2_9APHY|nr:uncharacterized protein LAESUDRAFT_461612 [Laetiporus sulphureus 93-53]KZT09830.1 hypothetical protein LAESUDRAFT_461612 [Laetiporus sulphureus 93-53]
MEEAMDSLRHAGEDLFSSQELRMKERPTRSSGTLFVDLGSDFGPCQANSAKPKLNTGNRAHKDAMLGTRSSTKKNLTSSGDELDFLSPDRRQAASANKKSSGGRSMAGAVEYEKEGQRDKPDKIFVNGEYHDINPDFPPDRKLPSFKKKTAGNRDSHHSESSLNSPAQVRTRSATSRAASSTPSSPPVASSSRLAPRLAYSGTRNDTIDGGTCGGQRKGRQKKQPPLHEPSNRKGAHTPISVGSDVEDVFDTPRAKAARRPKPRPTFKGSNAENDDGSEEEHPKNNMKRGKHFRPLEEFPHMSPLRNENAPEKTKGNGTAKDEEDPIAALSPLSSQAREQHATVKAATKLKLPQAFPMLSPLSSPVRKDHGRKSQVSSERQGSLSQGSRSSKGKERAGMLSSTESEDDEDAYAHSKSGYKVRPFPMETQVLEGIGHSPGKRGSGEDSGDEDLGVPRRERKKRRSEESELCVALHHMHVVEHCRSTHRDSLATNIGANKSSELNEDDLLYLNSAVDPSTLCPWCDEPLPSAPTPHLLALIATAREASWPDPRPTNCLGLRADLGLFVDVCQRHEFENHHVPLARRRGWPTGIDWDGLSARVQALQPWLQEIVDDVDEDFQLGAEKEDESDERSDGDKWNDRPRKGSVFWRDVVTRIKKKGSRQLAGVAGQFASFNKTQPGYYGELGYVIIHQTIYNLFPPSSFDPHSTLPLTPTDFIQLVLAPEAAVSLVMHDMDQTREQAIATLHESAEYGVAMFPDDHPDGEDVVGAGEQIIMRRAQRRRKELEEEEKMEEMWSTPEPPPEQLRKGRWKTRPKKMAAEDENSDVETSDAPSLAKGKGKTKLSRDRVKSSRARTELRNNVIVLIDDEDPGSMRKKGQFQEAVKSSRTRSKARSVAPPSDMDIAFCEDGSKEGGPNKPTRRSKPRRKGRAPDTNQERQSQREKENLPTSDSADSDARRVEYPDMKRMASPELRFGRDGNVHPSQGSEIVEQDATPKAQKLSQASSQSSTGAAVGVSQRSMHPLLRARAMHAQSDENLSQERMKDNSADTSDNDNRVGFNGSVRQCNIRARGRTKKDSESFRWLLESSSPASSQETR